MEKRIILEKRGRSASKIKELNLDNCRSTNIVGLTDEYTALEKLSLINVGLTTLKGFPKLPNLKKLELSDNRISNGLSYLTTSPKLTHLNLSGNKIKNLEELKALENFKHLEVLDLFHNEATLIESYKEKIFNMIPSLKYLDGFDMYDVEAPSEGDDDEEANGNDTESDEVSVGPQDDCEEYDDYDVEEEDAHAYSDEDEGNGEISLSEVYNDDLEEDNSDWNEDTNEDSEEESEEEDDDDDDDDDDDEDENEKKVVPVVQPPFSSQSEDSDTVKEEGASGKVESASTKEVAATDATGKEEAASAKGGEAADKESSDLNGPDSPTRGKKRKHDG